MYGTWIMSINQHFLSQNFKSRTKVSEGSFLWFQNFFHFYFHAFIIQNENYTAENIQTKRNQYQFRFEDI